MSLATDLVKVKTAVTALLQDVIASGKTVCFFDMNALMASLKLSHLPKSKFHDEICDVLAWSETHHKYGDWITCEYECSTRVLVQLAKAGDLQAACDEVKNHFVTYSEANLRALRKSFPVKKVKKQTLRVEIPASLDPDEVRTMIAQMTNSMANTLVVDGGDVIVPVGGARPDVHCTGHVDFDPASKIS